MSEKREKSRRAYIARIQVRYTDESGTPVTEEAMIEDRSESGFGINLRTPIALGTTVVITHREVSYVGVVKHVAPRPPGSIGKFLIGVELNTKSAAP